MSERREIGPLSARGQRNEGDESDRKSGNGKGDGPGGNGLASGRRECRDDRRGRYDDGYNRSGSNWNNRRNLRRDDRGEERRDGHDRRDNSDHRDFRDNRDHRDERDHRDQRDRRDQRDYRDFRHRDNGQRNGFDRSRDRYFSKVEPRPSSRLEDRIGQRQDSIPSDRSSESKNTDKDKEKDKDRHKDKPIISATNNGQEEQLSPQRKRPADGPLPKGPKRMNFNIPKQQQASTPSTVTGTSGVAKQYGNGRSYRPQQRPQQRPQHQQPRQPVKRISFLKTTRDDTVYDRVVQVGEGTYGKVYKAKNIVTSAFVALKRLRMESEREGFPITAMRETRLLQSFEHKNIVSLLEIMVENKQIYMVFDYADHDLSGLLANPDVKLTQGNCKHFFRQLAEGMQYLHARHVIHRDIKGSNLLIDKNGVLKIADFGLARKMTTKTSRDYTNRVITLWYRPPELLLGTTAYGREVDMWGIGCLLVELFTRVAIFQGKDEIHQLQVIYEMMGTPTFEQWPRVSELPWYELLKPKTFNRPQFGSKFSSLLTPACFDLSTKLLEYDPSKRLTARMALNHPYFREAPPPEPLDERTLQGEWHEFEAKKRRRKEREERRVHEEELKKKQQNKELSSEPVSMRDDQASASASEIAAPASCSHVADAEAKHLERASINNTPENVQHVTKEEPENLEPSSTNIADILTQDSDIMKHIPPPSED